MQRRTWIGLVGLGSAALAIPAWIRRDRGPARTESAAVVVTVPGTASDAGRRFIDANGNLVDIHTAEALVEFRAPDGSLRGSAAVRNPTAIASAHDGSLRVLTLDGTLAAFSTAGRAAGVVVLAGLAAPHDLVIADADVVVANTLAHQVAVFDLAGRPKTTFGASQLNGPKSIAARPDRAGYYVADAGNARIAAFSASGKLDATFGEYGHADGQMVSPRCVRVDGAGNVHVADLVANCVHVFDRNHRFVERKHYTMPNGAPASVQWLAAALDGSIVPSVVPSAA